VTEGSEVDWIEGAAEGIEDCVVIGAAEYREEGGMVVDGADGVFVEGKFTAGVGIEVMEGATPAEGGEVGE
jgi:hypothetical protein